MQVWQMPKFCKCGKCAECTQRAAEKEWKVNAKTTEKNERRRENRAAKRKAGDDGENERMREKRAAKKKAGDDGENERMREKRARIRNFKEAQKGGVRGKGPMDDALHQHEETRLRLPSREPRRDRRVQ